METKEPSDWCKPLEDDYDDDDKSFEFPEPSDWCKPLEDDDDNHDKSLEFPAFNRRRALGVKDAQEERLAGKSERSGTAVTKKTFKKTYQPTVFRRKQSHPGEGWVEWPTLGEGWRRKEVVRQSGIRIGQKDIYYMSPHGERARSRVELSSMLNCDLTSFEFKSGIFHKNGNTQPLRIRKPRKKLQERSSSEDRTLVCSKCGISFTGIWYDKQRKRPCCPFCWTSKTREHPLISSRPIHKGSGGFVVPKPNDKMLDDSWHKRRTRRFCGECRACRNRKDCGTCDFCIDKPMFGGSYKKRQKCRLRQCQQRARRHLLPSPLGQGDRDGSPQPHYTYSRRRKRTTERR